jgi:hypothetical protein
MSPGASRREGLCFGYALDLFLTKANMAMRKFLSKRNEPHGS